MNEDSEGFFSQRTFNIFFFGVFVFIMAMMLKEKLETPDNYLEDVKKSEIVAREQLAPPLKKVFVDALISEGQANRGSNRLSYGMTFKNNNGITDDDINKIGENSWIQYRKESQKERLYFFCKDKYGLEVTEDGKYISAIIDYDKASPCWNFEETLKNDLYHLVE
ncbi:MULTISPECIES: hypothetical protein [unclassified Psychrobacter]|uniref:hypothetical protein n=1 Tax=unclassified Psychrobacter TaxID=196806 RepID=UPI0018F5371A|nr:MULTISPECIES: hypothetical protein [unclassified Psychrobacter]